MQPTRTVLPELKIQYNFCQKKKQKKNGTSTEALFVSGYCISF